MKCHYEVLNISRDADQSEIKTAYRKLALQWHPDKNLNQPEAAKEQFQLVQQAYEVLSDNQERAWYDNHREEILRGAQSNYEDNSLDIFQYFTSTCYKGFDDTDKSFYSVYSEVFSKLASEEIEYLDDPDEYERIPVFGNSQSSYEVVKNFYSYWQGFSTKKSYAWLSPHNINETRDRRVVKLIEKENKKVQQKARRERNEQIHQLVQFVRKRDKRVIAQRKLEEERSQQNKIKAEQMRKEQIRQRNQELTSQVNKMGMSDLESQLREIEKNLLEEFGDSESDYNSESGDESSSKKDEEFSNISDIGKTASFDNADSLYCVVCNKLFKTIRSFKNHENSKKHRESVATLLQEMKNDDAFESDENISEKNGFGKSSSIEIENFNEEENGTDESKTNFNKNQKSVTEENQFESDVDGESFEDDDSMLCDSDIVCLNSSKRKNKKKKKIITEIVQSLSDLDEEFSSHDRISKVKESKESVKIKSKNKKKLKTQTQIDQISELEEDDNKLLDGENELLHDDKSKKINSNQKKKQKVKTKIQSDDFNNHDSFDLVNQIIDKSDDSDWDIKTKSKNKNKKSSIKFTTNNIVQAKSKTKILNDAEALDTDHICVTCKGNFSSKNKLFAHLKLTGHGVPLSNKVVVKEKKLNKKK